MDLGLLVTGAALVGALTFGRGNRAILGALLIAWALASSTFWLGMGKPATVFVLTAADFLIATGALGVVTYCECRGRSRTIGVLSLLLMPFHWAMSASTGNLNWTLYAAALNTVFVLQCFIGAGAFDGLGKFLYSFYGRANSSLLRDGETN